MARVRFMRQNPPYQIGEVAVFSDPITQRLLTAGVVTLIADEAMDPPMIKDRAPSPPSMVLRSSQRPR